MITVVNFSVSTHMITTMYCHCVISTGSLFRKMPSLMIDPPAPAINARTTTPERSYFFSIASVAPVIASKKTANA